MFLAAGTSVLAAFGSPSAVSAAVALTVAAAAFDGLRR
ncbi:hypothetical protein HNR21_001191 [Actinomadura cellulosilytica]|uniref:Uncharacterized protein n=1 Tax=Thermomonospora cellulosilytica TaxID=1411118 RepID=A0A7W3R7B1_9ACTN|nr:hypothetical protein [Thermomonospora cellulosilytica]